MEPVKISTDKNKIIIEPYEGEKTDCEMIRKVMKSLKSKIHQENLTEFVINDRENHR